MCQEGYHPIGPLKKKCGCKNRECMWGPSEKSFCRKNPTCPNIETPKNGRIECPVDSFCVISCDDGFEMEKGIMERTLRCNCDFDNYMCQWDHQIPVCRRTYICRVVLIFSSKIEIFVKKSEFFSKIEIFVKNRIFRQKLKFSSKIEIFIQQSKLNRNFW